MADAEGYLLSKTAVKQIAEVVRQVLGRRLPIAKKAGRTPSGGGEWHGILKSTIVAASDPFNGATTCTVQLYEPGPAGTLETPVYIISPTFPDPVGVINRDPTLSGGTVDKTYCRVVLVDGLWHFSWVGC